MAKMKSLFRTRYLFLGGGVLLATLLSFITDPDKGMSTILGGLSLVQGVWAVAIAHLARTAIMDYPESNWRIFFGKASQESTGAGLALVAGAICFVGLLMVFAPRAHAQVFPPGGPKIEVNTAPAPAKGKYSGPKVEDNHPDAWMHENRIPTDAPPPPKEKAAPSKYRVRPALHAVEPVGK